MPQLLKNNVSGVLALQLSNVATSMTLVDASNFPDPGSDFYLCTLIGLNGNGQESSWEVVRVTAKASNTLTITRAQESTTAATWTVGTSVQMRLTAASVIPGNVAKAGDTMTGKLSLPNVSTSAAPLNLGNPGTADVPSSPVNGDVWINNNGLQFRQGTTTQTVAILGGTQTFTGATTFSGTLTAQSNVNLGSNTGAATHNLGHGATTNGSTKAINIGPNGVSGSTTNVNLGSNVSGALSNVTAYGTFTAQANSGNSYSSVNRAGAAVEVGYRWQSVGSNVWLNYLPASSDTLTWFANAAERMSLSSAGVLTVNGGFRETRIAVAASDINVASGNYFTRTISGATTLTVSNVPSAGTAASFILDLTNGGSATITWWSGVKWASGTAPTLTASGRDVLGFFTHDGGTNWTGLLLGKDVK